MSGLYQRTSQSVGSLLDTDLTILANDEVLTYENESWKNKPAGGLSKEYAQFYLPSSQSITSGTFRDIINTQLDFRSSVNITHDSATGVLTLGRAGIYMITYNIQIIYTPSPVNWTIARCIFNGTPVIQTTVNDGTDAFYNAFHSGSVIVNATTPNETISFQVRTNTNTDVEGGNNPKPTLFTIHNVD